MRKEVLKSLYSNGKIFVFIIAWQKILPCFQEYQIHFLSSLDHIEQLVLFLSAVKGTNLFKQTWLKTLRTLHEGCKSS